MDNRVGSPTVEIDEQGIAQPRISAEGYHNKEVEVERFHLVRACQLGCSNQDDQHHQWRGDLEVQAIEEAWLE